MSHGNASCISFGPEISWLAAKWMARPGRRFGRKTDSIAVNLMEKLDSLAIFPFLVANDLIVIGYSIQSTLDKDIYKELKGSNRMPSIQLHSLSFS